MVTDRTKAQVGDPDKGEYVKLRRRTHHGFRALDRTNRTEEYEESNKDKATFGRSDAPLLSVQKFVSATSVFPAETTRSRRRRSLNFQIKSIF